MRDYDTFCFLENPKTGSTFVIKFLKAFAKEPLREFRKHQPLAKKEPGKLYFISTREPLDSYLSLYNFGADGTGTIRTAVAMAGKSSLYADPDGFDEWLRLFIDPALLGAVTGLPFRKMTGYGLMTARFNRLACFDFTFAEPTVDYVLRFESLRGDLARLIEDHLAHAVEDVHRAVDWIYTNPPVNTSSRRERENPFRVRRSTIALLVEREKPLYARYYPEVADHLRAGGSLPGVEIVDG